MTSTKHPEIKLYGYATSPYVRKVGCFLYYKQLPFTHIPVNPVEPLKTLDHTGGTQVPVLEIDGEYRRESSKLGHWLDERFPDRPIYPEEHRQTIGRIDGWVSDVFLFNIFRPAAETNVSLQQRFRGWRLAALVSAHTPLPETVRHKWPEFLPHAPFIKAMAERMDLSESVTDANRRVMGELIGHLGEGPYLGGLEHPTMLDLAVFPQLVFGYMFGLEEYLSVARIPVIKAWMSRMSEHLPANPTLVSDDMQIRTLASGLA